MRKKPDSTIFKKYISKKFRKWFYLFTCILPDYVPHENQKEFWRNSHFENTRAGFLLRYQNSLQQTKVGDTSQCSKMQIIKLQNLNIKTCFIQFLWFFRLKCWFKGQIISKIHLSLPNAYKLMCFDRNINKNMDVKFLSDIIGHCTDWCPRLYLQIFTTAFAYFHGGVIRF